MHHPKQAPPGCSTCSWVYTSSAKKLPSFRCDQDVVSDFGPPQQAAAAAMRVIESHWESQLVKTEVFDDIWSCRYIWQFNVFWHFELPCWIQTLFQIAWKLAGKDEYLCNVHLRKKRTFCFRRTFLVTCWHYLIDFDTICRNMSELKSFAFGSSLHLPCESQVCIKDVDAFRIHSARAPQHSQSASLPSFFWLNTNEAQTPLITLHHRIILHQDAKKTSIQHGIKEEKQDTPSETSSHKTRGHTTRTRSAHGQHKVKKKGRRQPETRSKSALMISLAGLKI